VNFVAIPEYNEMYGYLSHDDALCFKGFEI
jgi:hypothetical protein